MPPGHQTNYTSLTDVIHASPALSPSTSLRNLLLGSAARFAASAALTVALGTGPAAAGPIFGDDPQVERLFHGGSFVEGPAAHWSAP